MFCYQCQEALKNEGCKTIGVCRKSGEVSNLQDLLMYVVKGISIVALKAKEMNIKTPKANEFITDALFATITNANFDETRFNNLIKEGLKLRANLQSQIISAGGQLKEPLHDAVTWHSDNEKEFLSKASHIGIQSTKDEDIRSLREIIAYGLKGMAAYAHHARLLGQEDESIYTFMQQALSKTLNDELVVDELFALVFETGQFGVSILALLDKANTEAYGKPEITKVNLGVRNNPGILISGHDLKDLKDLLDQTKGTGIDVYTHCEMLPAHYYPVFKEYDHLVGNYGNAWWQQNKEFDKFNGPILMTTNCITPPKQSYKDRIYTTSVVGFKEVKHIESKNNSKDFNPIIEQAKKCPPPQELEQGEIVGGFAHDQVLALADKIVGAVKSGAIKQFCVMAGCDGRHKTREYYTNFAQNLPKDTVILTAGCAKYRYNKLDLGTIGDIPRVIDAGQCNDSYSLAVIALKLKEVFGLKDINDLPIYYDIAWYEQKAVIVLLALLHLGVKNIHLGPTLPAFLSPNVAKVLVENFGIASI